MFSHELECLQKDNLYRAIKDRSSPQGSRIYIDGREFINFASNDYLGLASHPEIIRAASKAMDEFGFGGGASRLLSGGSALHYKLEDRIARFKGTEAALIFNSGYAANTGIIPTIAREGDLIFSDELNHASIVDGCRLSRAKTLIYRHRDVNQLEELIKKAVSSYKAGSHPEGRYVIITDTVFSMDGDISPLKEIYNLCLALKFELSILNPLILYIDDAHGTGVLGEGRGALAHFNIKPEPWIIQMGTFSKALGSFGAFVAGSRDVIEWIINTARSFIFSTALPACVVAASIKGIELAETQAGLIERLWRNRYRLFNALKEIGYDTGKSESPIIPIKFGSIKDTLNLSRHLYENGIYAPAIRPPTVKEPRLRITVTAAHSDEDIDSLIQALAGYESCNSSLPPI